MAATSTPIILTCPLHDGTDPDSPLDPTVCRVFGTFSTAKRAWIAAVQLIEGVYQKPNGQLSMPRFEIDDDRSDWHAYWKYTKRGCVGILRRKHSVFYVRSDYTYFNRPSWSPLSDLETDIPTAAIRYEEWRNPKVIDGG